MVLCRKLRPERLQFHSHCSAAANAGPAAAAALPTTCAQEARLTADVTAVTDAISGGFACFAASYPQYCESKCTAANAFANDSCCQLMVEPSYSLNHGPTQILEHLFVGSQTDATDAEVISRLGITHVLNVSASCPQSHHVPASNFMRIPVNDGYVDKLLPHFKRAFHFLESVRLSNGRVLVHCLAGVSRSPTITIAYIMQHLRMSQDDAYRHVKSRRQSISPNFNFLGQLMEFERQLQQERPTDVAETATNLAVSEVATLACSEAKRQRQSPPTASSASVPAPGQSPTSALSRLTFAVHQHQHHQMHRRRQQRPRSVALTGQAEAAVAASAPTTAAAAVSMPPSASVSASGSLGGSQEITCS